jgi:hypothetical protein
MLNVTCTTCGYDGHTAENCPEKPATPKNTCHWCKKQFGVYDPFGPIQDECPDCIDFFATLQYEEEREREEVESGQFAIRCRTCTRWFTTSVRRATTCDSCLDRSDPEDMF